MATKCFHQYPVCSGARLHPAKGFGKGCCKQSQIAANHVPGFAAKRRAAQGFVPVSHYPLHQIA